MTSQLHSLSYTEQQHFNEVRCPSCQKLLFKISGFGSIIEIVCRGCGQMVRYPILLPELRPDRR